MIWWLKCIGAVLAVLFAMAVWFGTSINSDDDAEE